MTEEKFEELLNLSLDREISPAEDAVLKAELRNNPDRRRTCELYRKLDSATFRVLAAEEVAIARRNRGRRVLYYLGNASMAAACLVLAFVLYSPFKGQAPEPFVLAESATTALPAPATTADLPAAKSAMDESMAMTLGLLAQLNDFPDYRSSLIGDSPLSEGNAVVIEVSTVRDAQPAFPPVTAPDGLFRPFNTMLSEVSARPSLFDRTSVSAFRSDLGSFTFYR